MKAKIPYEHYEGCPCRILKLDTIKTDPCSCKEVYELNEPQPKNKIQAWCLKKLKEIRFKEYEIDLTL